MNTHKNNLFIIGPLGAGKSSVGYHLAKRLQLPFYDSDREVEKRSGVDIDWMFAVEGEAGFRQRELQVIQDLCSQDGIVLATGGGTVVIPEARETLTNNGITIYLTVPFEEQLNRVKRFLNKRPMLGEGQPEQLERLNHQRELLYQEIADLTYQNDTKNQAALAKKIIHDIRELKKNQPSDGGS